MRVGGGGGVQDKVRLVVPVTFQTLFNMMIVVLVSHVGSITLHS